MKGGIAGRHVQALALTGMLVLLAAAPAGARPSAGPAVDIHTAAGLAPDGRSMSVQLFASCPERWSVVSATVTVSQPQASGTASFPLTCTGGVRGFSVDVPTAATFVLGSANVTASITIQRGKTQSATDAEVVDVQPLVRVRIADDARLEPGGAALVVDVTVACPVGSTGRESRINVSQGQTASGNGTYLPVCDGAEHTFAVRVEAFQGAFAPGDARGLTFADVEYAGTSFTGVDDSPLRIVG